MIVRSTLAQPRDEVVSLIRFAAKGGISTSDVFVRVTSTSGSTRGRAWRGFRRTDNGMRRYMLVRVPEPGHFPRMGRRNHGRMTNPLVDLYTWQEALVYIAAHEFRHLWQFKNGRVPRELDAENWAVRRLLAFRGEQS